MKTLLFTPYLAAKNGGPNQDDIALWIESHPDFLAWVETCNKSNIPYMENGEPPLSWWVSQDFHPVQLVPAACEALHCDIPQGIILDIGMCLVDTASLKNKQ